MISHQGRNGDYCFENKRSRTCVKVAVKIELIERESENRVMYRCLSRKGSIYGIDLSE